MRNAALSFHIARRHGFEFVFSSGHALRYPMHTHVSTYTVTIVQRGVVRLARGAGVETLRQEAVYIVAPHEPHSPAYSDDFALVSLCIDKGHFSSMPRNVLTELLLPRARGLVDAALLTHEHLRGLLAGMERIYATAPARPSGEPALSGLFRAFPSEAESPFQHIRRFKKDVGLTPHQYRIQDRIRTAKRLLANSVPIAEAALEAGFYDQSHLNRCFHRSIGMTPHAYRNACRFLDEV